MTYGGPQYPHLEGLRRLSPCCRARVAHPFGINHPSLKMALAMICLKCRMPVHYFLLKNKRGEIVWPVPKGVKLPPKPPKRKRSRRKPREQEPDQYGTYLTRSIKLLLRGL